MSRSTAGHAAGRGRRQIEAALQPLHRRIEEWRTTRVRRTRMPEELWDAAVVAAREFGLWSVSQVLRVNYESLKSRLHAGAAAARSAPPTAPDSGFVECTVEDLLGTESGPDTRTVIELTSSAGARLVVRLGRHDLDVAALAHGFWSAGK